MLAAHLSSLRDVICGRITARGQSRKQFLRDHVCNCSRARERERERADIFHRKTQPCSLFSPQENKFVRRPHSAAVLLYSLAERCTCKHNSRKSSPNYPFHTNTSSDLASAILARKPRLLHCFNDQLALCFLLLVEAKRFGIFLWIFFFFWII